MSASRRDILRFSIVSATLGFAGCSKRTSPTMSEINIPSNASTVLPNRIIFPGNPWPNGHAIIDFRWSARIVPASGLWFDLRLESADYNAEAPGRVFEGGVASSNWMSKGVWNNYHSCTLSSTDWDNAGFKLTRGKTPFDLDSLNGEEFIVDSLPIRREDTRAFGIYLQGHDTSADHRISFKRLEGKNQWAVAWQGRIALTYLGDDRFIYQFKALVSKTAFDGIEVPPKTTKEEAVSLLSRFVAKPDKFTLEHIDEQICFKLA
jgi:hypothetical protein